MTVHALLVDPPRPGLVLSDLVATSPLSGDEAADLYAAMAKDAMDAAVESGGDLLVNYRPDDLLPEAHRTGTDPRAEVRALAVDALPDPDRARFEVQVGSTFGARAGNTVTHLLREEGEASAAVLDPRAPTVSRTDLDGAAMKLRRSEVVIGPAPGGRAAYLGLSEPIDFEGAFAPPALDTLAGRGVDAGVDVDFTSMHPLVETGPDLRTLLAVVRARRRAGRRIPEHTARALDALDLRFGDDGDGVER